jgi:hypothetical protein
VSRQEPRGDAAAQPAPCPWCGQRGTRELTLIASRASRYFRCDRCHRTFAIDIVIAVPPRTAPDEDS